MIWKLSSSILTKHKLNFETILLHSIEVGRKIIMCIDKND